MLAVDEWVLVWIKSPTEAWSRMSNIAMLFSIGALTKASRRTGAVAAHFVAARGWMGVQIVSEPRDVSKACVVRFNKIH